MGEAVAGKYRVVLEVEEDGRIWIHFGRGFVSLSIEVPDYKYLRRIRGNIFWAIEAARKWGVLEEVEEGEQG